jgi:hypothetical protein
VAHCEKGFDLVEEVKFFCLFVSKGVQRFFLTFVLKCAYNEIVCEGKSMLFVYLDYNNAVLTLGEDLPKALILTDTLGLGRLFAIGEKVVRQVGLQHWRLCKCLYNLFYWRESCPTSRIATAIQKKGGERDGL